MLIGKKDEFEKYNKYQPYSAHILTKKKDLFAFRIWWTIHYEFEFDGKMYGPFQNEAFGGSNGICFLNEKNILIMIDTSNPNNNILYSKSTNTLFNLRKQSKSA